MQNPFVIPIIFQYIAIFLGFFAFKFVPYLILILKRKVKPNISTWLILGLAALSSFIVSLLSGVTIYSIVVVLVAGLGPLMIAIVAIVTNQFYFESRWLEIVCFTLCIIGLLFYFQTSNVFITQSILILVDIIACIPLLNKIWFSKNENEPLSIYAFYMIVLLVSLFTQKYFDYASSMYLIYILLMHIVIVASIILKDKKLSNRHNPIA